MAIGSCPDAKGLFRERVRSVTHLVGLGLGKRGAEDAGLVVFKALDFGLHVLEAGLFGGEGRFFGFWRFDGWLFGYFDGCFSLGDGWFRVLNGFAGRVVWGEALGL